MRRFTSTWGVDALDDEDTTSAKNNSSAITLLNVDGRYLLFNGDAGITALTHAADELDAIRNGADLRANSDTASRKSSQCWSFHSQSIDRNARAAGGETSHKRYRLNGEEGGTETSEESGYECIHTSWSQCCRNTWQDNLLFA